MHLRTLLKCAKISGGSMSDLIDLVLILNFSSQLRRRQYKPGVKVGTGVKVKVTCFQLFSRSPGHWATIAN